MTDTQPAGTPAADTRNAVARIVAKHWAPHISDAGRHAMTRVLAALDGETDPEELGVCDGPCSEAIRAAADTPEPSTPPAERDGERRAAAGPPPGTLAGPGVLGRALVDPFRVWRYDLAKTGRWSCGDGQWLTKDKVEARYGPVREVLLVDPAAGQVLEAVRRWFASISMTETAEEADLALALCALDGYQSAAAVDALDRPTGTIEPQRTAPRADFGETHPFEAARSASPDALSGAFTAIAEHGRRQVEDAAEPAPEPAGEAEREELAQAVRDAGWAGKTLRIRDHPEPAGDGPGWDWDQVRELAKRLYERDAVYVEALLNDHHGWRSRAQVAEQERDAARAELAEMTASRDRWHGHALDLRGELDEVTADRDRWAKVSGEWADETIAARNEADAARAEAARMHDLAEQRFQALEQVSAERDRLREQRDGVREHLSAAHELRHEVERERDAARRIVAQVNADLDAARAELPAAWGTAADATKERNAARTIVSQLNADLAEQTGRADTAEIALADAKGRLAEVTAELAEMTASRDRWHGHALDLRAELDEVTAERNRIERVLNSAQEQCDRAVEALATARRDAAGGDIVGYRVRLNRLDDGWHDFPPDRVMIVRRPVPGSPQPAPDSGEETDMPEPEPPGPRGETHRQMAYDAVYEVIRQHPPRATDDYGRAAENARVWRAVEAALDAQLDGKAWADLEARVERLGASQDAAHDDLAAILRELGLGDQARTISAQQVVQNEVLPAIRRLRADLAVLRLAVGPGIPTDAAHEAEHQRMDAEYRKVREGDGS